MKQSARWLAMSRLYSVMLPTLLQQNIKDKWPNTNSLFRPDLLVRCQAKQPTWNMFTKPEWNYTIVKCRADWKLLTLNFLLCASFLPKSALLKLYYALIHPYLIYCLPAWRPIFPMYMNKLSALQNKAVKLIAGRRCIDHVILFRPYVMNVV